MTLNPSKSGVMVLKQNTPSGTLESIPYVGSYRYLGTHLTGNLEPDCHLESISRKANYQTRRLAPLRHCLDIKFNVNLFKMLVLPSVRLLGCVYKHTGKKGKKKIETHVRRRLRGFCVLPWTCPNELINCLIG